MRGERSKRIIDFDGRLSRRQKQDQSTAINENVSPIETGLHRGSGLAESTSPDISPDLSKSSLPNSVHGDMTSEQLILEVGRGNRDAFRLLFERVTPRVKGYLMHMGASESQAEEITQDVMVAVWRRAHTYESERAAATTWIYQIARNRRIDLWRREHRLTLDPHEPLLHGAEPEQPYQLLDAAEEAASVRDAIAQLPDELSQLLRMAYFDGLTHQEIAHKTGLPLGTAKSRIRKATKIVRNTLDPQSN